MTYSQAFDRVLAEAANTEPCIGKDKCVPMTWAAHYLSVDRLAKGSMTYSASYLEEGLGLLTQTPAVSWFVIISPFSAANWLALWAVLLLLVTAWYALEHPFCSGKLDSETDTNFSHFLYEGLTGCFQVDFGKPRTGPSPLVLLGIAIMGTVFVASYTAGLTNQLVEVAHAEVNTVEELIQKRLKLCVMYKSQYGQMERKYPQLHSLLEYNDVPKPYTAALAKLRNGTCSALLNDHVLNKYEAMQSKCGSQAPPKSVESVTPYVFFAPESKPEH